MFTGLLAFIPYVGPAAITLLLVAAGALAVPALLVQTLRDALRSPAGRDGRPMAPVAVHRIDAARTGALRSAHRGGPAIAPAAPVAPVTPAADPPSQGTPFADVLPTRGRHDR